MPPTFVQTVNGRNASAGANCTLAFGSNNGLGNFLVSVARITGSTTTPTFSDSQSNTWTIAIDNTTGSDILAIAFAPNIKAGANTVTINPNNGASSVQACAEEYSGVKLLSPLDQSTSATGTSTTPSSGSVVTTAANELIIGGVKNSSSNTLTLSGTTGTLRDVFGLSGVTTNSCNGGESDMVQASAGSVSMTFTYAGATPTWIAGIATFFSQVTAASITHQQLRHWRGN